MPMNARVAISWSAVVDERGRAASRARRSRSPTWSAPRRPNRSPRLPTVSSRPANTSVYESTIHCSWLLVGVELASISVGIATLRIELSSTITSRLKHRTTRISQRRWYAFSCTRSERLIPQALSRRRREAARFYTRPVPKRNRFVSECDECHPWRRVRCRVGT